MYPEMHFMSNNDVATLGSVTGPRSGRGVGRCTALPLRKCDQVPAGLRSWSAPADSIARYPLSQPSPLLVYTASTKACELRALIAILTGMSMAEARCSRRRFVQSRLLPLGSILPS